MATTTNLGRPRTAPGPPSLLRLLVTGGHWPRHLGLVAAHSVAGEAAAAVFDVGAAAAHTGDTLDNTALLPWSRTADEARYSAPREHTARHPASVTKHH